PLQGPSSQATPRSGGREPPMPGRCGAGSLGYARKRILLPLLPNPEGKSGAQTHPRPAGPQQVSVEVPRGIPGLHHPFSGSGGLKRRLLSCLYLPGAQMFPALYSGRAPLPVYGAALWPVLGPQGVHEM
ncbi:hypothetical protein G0U57_019207, partial [Chelydra serpentina]